MYWSSSPVGALSRYTVEWGILYVGRQTELEKDWPLLPTRKYSHRLASLIVPADTVKEKGSSMFGDEPKGQRSVLHILLFLHVWKEYVRTAMAMLSPLSPQGLVHVDPGWVHRIESALRLFVCQSPLHRPPAGYVSGPDRLPDSGIHLGEQGKRGNGLCLRAGMRQTLSFSFTPITRAVLPFMMSDSTLCVTNHHPGAAGLCMWSYAVGKRLSPRKRESASVRSALQPCSKFPWTKIMWKVTHRIQIQIFHAVLSLALTNSFSVVW